MPKEVEETPLHCLEDLFQLYSKVLVGTGYALIPQIITHSSACGVTEHALEPTPVSKTQELQRLKMLRLQRSDLQPTSTPC